MPSLTQEAFPAHLAAQQLNNCGARHIENGDFDRAIAAFVKARRIWEQVADDEACSCSNCSLDECILRSRQDVPFAAHHCTHSKSAFSNSETLDSDHTEDRFIYRRPIYSSHKSIGEAHSTGVTLSLIILLNLAMAHHLSAIHQQLCRRRLQKALQLYELAHQLQLEEGICSPRATLIVANNVGEIHRAVENHAKHAMCMQNLLSTMMYMIDCRIPASSIELEGFFRNTSQLILHNNCAGAA
jgi:TPR repeat protein